MEVIDIEKAAEQLLEYWSRQKILSPPNTLDDILHFEFSKNIQLPEDFRRFFMITNGMLNLFPNYFDSEGFLFYPLQEINTLEDELIIERDYPDEQCLIFAEFMHKSWWYGVKFSKSSNNYVIGVIPSVSKFKVITKNLGKFIHLYMKDDSILYEY